MCFSRTKIIGMKYKIYHKTHCNESSKHRDVSTNTVMINSSQTDIISSTYPWIHHPKVLRIKLQPSDIGIVPKCYFRGLHLIIQRLFKYYEGPHLFSSFQVFKGLEFSRSNSNIFKDFSSKYNAMVLKNTQNVVFCLVEEDTYWNKW